MEKEFIPYEQALALKEIDYDEPCFKKYIAGCLWSNPTTPEIYKNIHSNSSDCLAPTFSQAFRWFREKYGIFTSIVPNKYGSLDSFIGWIYVPSNGTTKDINVGDRKGFSTPEEAELACLRKLIEIVKTK